MARRRTKAKPTRVPSVDRTGRFDLSTTEGTAAHMADFEARKRVAADFYRSEFHDMAEQLDALDRALVAVAAQLHESEPGSMAGQDMMDAIRASYLLRCALPLPTASDETAGGAS